MFGIGIPEFVLILIVGLIVFGPSKLPEVGRAVGKGLREFRRASNALQMAINAPEESSPPKHPVATQEEKPQEPPKEEKKAERVEEERPKAAAQEVPPAYEPPTQESVRAQLEKKNG